MADYKSSIRNWPSSERPREKLLKYGEHTLSDSELLAILLRTGLKGESAIDVGRKLMQEFGSFRNMGHTTISRWRQIKGMGDAKICQVKAALEIARRFGEEEPKGGRVKVSSPQDVVGIMMPRMRDLKKEIFKVVHLNSRNIITEISELESGTVNQANPIIREIFHNAIEFFSASLICLHNHPSGDPAPSGADKNFTKTLVKAGDVLDIKVLDHIIIGDGTYYSFADSFAEF